MIATRGSRAHNPLAMDYSQTTFLLSATKLDHLPPDTGNEVAFVGRSNAGKSSAINAITHQKIARVSKTPGRTQAINFFVVKPLVRLVDLPGYGFAKTPKLMQRIWGELIHSYLESRKSLKGLVVLMDIRHPLSPLDLQLIEWATDANINLHIVLTKADKLGKQAQQNVQKQIQLSNQLLSVVTKQGMNELYKKLDEWLIF